MQMLYLACDRRSVAQLHILRAATNNGGFRKCHLFSVTIRLSCILQLPVDVASGLILERMNRAVLALLFNLAQSIAESGLSGNFQRYNSVHRGPLS